jgi:hypothetical protein
MSAAIVDRKLLDVAGGSEHFLGAGTYKPSPVERINSVFHFPFSIHFPFEEPQKRRKGRHFLHF